MISPDARRASPLSGRKATYRPVQISRASSQVEAPQALTLAKEPRADVERYDDLRQAVEEARHAQ